MSHVDSNGRKDRVNREYERIIDDLRLRMRYEGTLSGESATESARLAEVHVYQEAMRSKFEALGVPGAQVQHFPATANSSEAVRDGVAKYHSHCQKLGRLYA